MRHVIGAVLGILVLAQASVAAAQAKNYQIWRIDSGLVGAYAPATGAGGFGAVVEPKINVLDFLSAGLRFEGVVLLGGSYGAGGQAISVGLGVDAAVMAKADFFFTNTTVRPFAGLGVGMISLGSQKVDTNPGGGTIAQQAGR